MREVYKTMKLFS